MPLDLQHVNAILCTYYLYKMCRQCLDSCTINHRYTQGIDTIGGIDSIAQHYSPLDKLHMKIYIS